MTMLDRMRRRKNILKWLLALVVVAFILLYIPDYLGTSDTVGARDVVAQVAGHRVTAAEFRRAYQGQLQAYRTAYGGKISDQMLRQLGIEQQILQQMVDERAALAEADRLGIRVTDEEVRERILTMPAFQQNGQFIGEARYRQLLSRQRPPVTVAEFEEGLRRSLVLEKLRAALTDWVTVGDAEVEEEVRRRNEKVRLELVVFRTDDFRTNVTLSDADLAAYFEAHKERYRVGERRRIRYLLIDTDAIRKRVTVGQREIERAYYDNIEQYSTPEQIRASHILLKTEGKDEAAVRALAEKLAKEARSGADFAALARKHSEDEASRDRGGDLDYFARGRMPEFEDAAFAMAPGTVSDPVKTQYGFHVIKVVDKKPATTRSLDEVKAQIADQIAAQRAQTQAAQLAEKLEDAIDDPADLDRVARANGLTVQESGFFGRNDPILGLGAGPDVSQRAFELGEGEVTGHITVPRGIVFFTVTGRQDPYVPKLDEVKERVRNDLTGERAADLARKRATELHAAVTRGTRSDLAAAAKAAGTELKTTDLITRGSALPEVGVSPAVDRVAFSLPIGQISQPISTDMGAVVLRVLERTGPKPEELTASKSQVREDLLADRRNRFFTAYMVKAKQAMDIRINRDVLERLTRS